MTEPSSRSVIVRPVDHVADGLVVVEIMLLLKSDSTGTLPSSPDCVLDVGPGSKFMLALQANICFASGTGEHESQPKRKSASNTHKTRMSRSVRTSTRDSYSTSSPTHFLDLQASGIRGTRC